MAGTWRIRASSPARSSSAPYVPAVNLGAATPGGHTLCFLPRAVTLRPATSLWSHSSHAPRAVTLHAATPRGHPPLAYALPWALVVFTLIHSLARYVLDLTGLQETSPALGVGLTGV